MWPSISHFLNYKGRLLGVKDRIISVALGKAHCVVLTDKGVVYTLGINNKGQCGRDMFSTTYNKHTVLNAPHQSTTLQIPSSEQFEDEFESEDSATEMKPCAPTEHRWTVDRCMVCMQCGQCTVGTMFILHSSICVR